MLIKAWEQGIVFKKDVLENARDDANVHGRIYNSRDGLAIYYRYHPRDIGTLYKDKLKGNTRIKIHESVIDRMERRTSNYAPENLPLDFDVVDTSGAVRKTPFKVMEEERKASIKKIKRWVGLRKWLYGIFLESTIAIAFFVWYWRKAELQSGEELGLFAKAMNWVLPDFCSGFITVTVIQHPVYFWSIVLVFVIYWRLWNFFRSQTVEASEKLREQILSSLRKPEPPQSSEAKVWQH
jgi:hypothetical protein